MPTCAEHGWAAARLLLVCLVSTALVASCGGGSGVASGGATGPVTGGGPPDAGTQVAAVAATVDDGPAAAGGGSVNTLFVTVTLCAPGSTTACQTIDHVQVDTGSTGFRVLAEVLGNGLTADQLPQATDVSGSPVVECLQFADGYSWGPVRKADLTVGTSTAASVPIQVIGDPAFASRTVPSACSSYVNAPENTVAQFGANGILGIGNFLQDCGSGCASGQQDGSFYNVCPAATAPRCTPAAVPLAAQVQNPAALFAAGGNGVVLKLPAVSPGGAPTAAGSLIFGVDTASNNALGSATVFALDGNGNLSSAVAGLGTFASSFIDSGSNGYFFDDASLQQCSGGNSGFYCPAAPASFAASITGQNGATASVAFSVDSAASSGSDAALPNLAGPAGTGLGSGAFDWGLPFFYGRTIYVLFEGAQAGTSSVAGPWIAF